MIESSLLTLLLLAADPRIRLVELQAEKRHDEALSETTQLLREQPEEASSLGLHYLQGRLLDLRNEPRAASTAYAEAMAAVPTLAAYARLHLALAQERLGHPEVAAGLVATLLGSSPPRPLLEPASRLLSRTLSRGGDCRLLTSLAARRFPSTTRRVLQLSRADCALQEGATVEARALLLDLLDESAADAIAREAAERLAALGQGGLDVEVAGLLGVAFHHHRDFERSARYLQQAARTDRSQRVDFELSYRLARSHFWRGSYEAAAAGYRELAARTATPREAAQALYQQGRSWELLGSWPAASQSYQQAYLAQPTGNWAAAALISTLRLEWHRGRESEALELYDLLRSRRQWRFELSRAALFLASSELVQGKTERTRTWLRDAERSSRGAALEVAYWEGRLLELEGDPEGAIESYVRMLEEDPFHPMSRAAAERIGAAPLAEHARRMGLQRLRSDRTEDLHAAWILLRGEERLRARQRLLSSLGADKTARAFLQLQPVPVPEWPLWQSRLTQPEELLLGLGLWREGAPVAVKHFPLSEPNLALTAGQQLAAAGLDRRSLWIAEVLQERVPRRVPKDLLPVGYRRLLYPLPFRELLESASSRHGIDAYLLAGIIREESRFDPEATSAASAHGLTQFVLPTAQRLARKVDLSPITPEDLYEPEVAIELGAAYLSELLSRYDGEEAHAVTAYNAGEPQVDLWRTYCYTSEPEEFYTKVSFRETRNYLAKVLRSQAHYRSLYAEPAP